MTAIEQVAAELASEPHLWWGHTAEDGWVVLDRHDARNGAESRYLIRCRDWSTFTVSRAEFGSSRFAGFKSYLAGLPAERVQEACNELLALRREFSGRAATLRVTEFEVRRQRSEAVGQHLRDGGWRTCEYPVLFFLYAGKQISVRKQQLWGAACCRRFWDVLKDENCRQGILLAERLADGEGSREEAERLGYRLLEKPPRLTDDIGPEYLTVEGCCRNAVFRILRDAEFYAPMAGWGDVFDGWKFAAQVLPRRTARGRPVTKKALEEEQRAQADLLREIVGNPFEPIRFDPAWRTQPVLDLAAGSYARRAFDALPILADALEEAGCDNAELLAHLRGRGPHLLGCWALDAVLDKEAGAVYPGKGG
jgi:hypothetical protein